MTVSGKILFLNNSPIRKTEIVALSKKFVSVDWNVYIGL